MTRSEMLIGGGTHDFEVSPVEALEGKFSQIFFPEGGATIDEVRINGEITNVLANFSNTSVIKAGTLWAVPEGQFIHYISGTLGQVNYNKA